MTDAALQDLRELDLVGITTMVDWASREGWNPGLADASAFRAADPQGFLGLFEGTDLVATVSAVRYGDGFGFIGFFIVRSDRRGRGLGGRIWRAGLERLGNRTVGLDGVVEQQANYAARGFAPAFRSVRFAGAAPVDAGAIDPRVAAFRSNHAADLLALDRRCFPARREAFIGNWIASPRRSFVHLGEAGVDGFLTLRECRVGWKIGPLVARTPDGARRLFAAALREAAGRQVVIDVPEPNGEAIRMAEGAGLAPAFETMRMYRGLAPALPLGQIYGITSFELG